MNNKISLPPISDILNNSILPLPVPTNYNNPLNGFNSYNLNSYTPINGMTGTSLNNYSFQSKSNSPRSSESSESNSPIQSNFNYNYNYKKIELPNKITANTVSSNEKRKTRNNLPKETTYILLKWLNDHLNHPYPNNFEKNQLMSTTGLNQQQLSNWFINARRRKIKMLKQHKNII